jgi:hypothetical protein
MVSNQKTNQLLAIKGEMSVAMRDEQRVAVVMPKQSPQFPVPSDHSNHESSTWTPTHSRHSSSLNAAADSAAPSAPFGSNQARTSSFRQRWPGSELQQADGTENRQGREINRRLLTPWKMKGRTPLQLDPVGMRLLLTVSKKGQNSANPALIDAATLQRQKMIPIDVEEAQGLNS